MRPLGAVPGYPGRDPSGLCQGSSQRDPSGLCWGPWGCARVPRKTPRGCSGVSRKRCRDCSRIPKESPLGAVPGSQAGHPAPHPRAALAVGLHTPPELHHQHDFTFPSFSPPIPCPSLRVCTFRANFEGSEAAAAPCCMSAACGLPVCY